MAKAKHTIRIISGTHRSRRIPVLDFEGLRPTGDRVRETAFNWLQMNLQGMIILDLCAGAGALGFEAASREAKQVILIEKNIRIANQLSQISAQFEFSNCMVRNQTAESYLSKNDQLFDVVFLDPPFSLGMMQKLTDSVIPFVNINGFVYREASISEDLIKLPENWQLYRFKAMGQVKIELWKRIS
jgi:16S rRNA (guanine966-N2)-methyltransferase